MRFIKWRWFLPAVLTALAVASHVYAPYQYNAGVRARAHFSWPTPHTVVAQCLSFPSVILTYPLRRLTGDRFSHKSDLGIVRFGAEDWSFFAGVAFLWYWVGAVLDRRFGRDSWILRYPAVRIAGLSGGVVFGAVTAYYGDYQLSDLAVTQRMIGACGLAWACVLTGWFVRQLMRELGAAKRVIWVARAATAALFPAAALWIGGPLGATQALGEYLRPTAIQMPAFARSWLCSTGETPPAEVMKVVEAQREFYGLTLQRLAVCRGIGWFSHSGEMGCGDVEVGYWTARTSWSRPSAGCGVIQFRRHFGFLIAYRGTVTYVALIQSRWDYLRLNWNRVLSAWSWPYGGVPELPQDQTPWLRY